MRSNCNHYIKNKVSKVEEKNIVILGAGESGVGAALLAKQKGYNVFVSDGGKIAENYKTDLLNNDIPFEEGNHSIDKILLANVVVKSPGIPNENKIVQLIKQDRKSVV